MSLLGSLQPEKQKVDDAISVVCDRLEHASLLQDRRAAVLSLRGFAREYKEAVAAGGLRGLLRSLQIDQEDEQILKASLECILALFTVDASNVVDDTALWIADEFTLRTDNAHALLQILGNRNYYIRLYSIQIIRCILECRASQLQECIMSSPIGINAIVAILDEQREQIRNECILLLSKIVLGHADISKRVAFENAFDKIFTIVEAEGGLHGGIITTDCFILLQNLLRDNLSNQNWFREMEFFKRFTALIQEVDKAGNFTQDLSQNILLFLKITRLFVPRRTTESANQLGLMRAGVLTQLIAFAHHAIVPEELRAACWTTTADVIFNNQEVQDFFIEASAIAANPLEPTNNLSPLLTLLFEQDRTFDLRYAVLQCLQSYSTGSRDRKLRHIQELIDAWLNDADHSILECILTSQDEYNVWFAGCFVLFLTLEDEDARQSFTALIIGDSDAGEEEVSIIQTISGNLITAIQRGRQRAITVYLMILSSWLFESPDNVADFLGEQSTLQAIINELQNTSSPIIKGLCAVTLSICYAFNFAEKNPLTRRTLQDTFTRVGRQDITGAIVQLSQLETSLASEYEKPFLDPTYVDFFRDNYGLIRKAIDQPPVPLRTRKEEQAQQEQARNDGLLSELEDELERKNKSLDSLSGTLQVRQEELQRLRDEVAYINRRNETETAQAKKDIEKYETEAVRLQRELEHYNRETSDAQRENALLSNKYEKLFKETTVLKETNAGTNERITTLEERTKSLESQLAAVQSERDALQARSSAQDEELQVVHTKLTKLTTEHELLELECKSNKVIISDMEDALSKSKAAQKKAEVGQAASRTKAHDLETEMKGQESQLRALEKDLARQATMFAEEKQELMKSGNANGATSSKHTEEEYECLLKDREELKKQLEQAQEDLMLLMEDAAGEQEGVEED